MTAAQAMCPPQAPLSSILLAVFVILHANSATTQPLPSLPNTYHWRFYARETYNGHNKVIGTQDCPLEGCRTKIEIPLHPESISTVPSPFLCFPYRNTGECLQEVSTYGGCRYWSCRMESTSRGGTMFTNLKTHFQLSISDPWNERWRIGVMGKLYPNGYARYPVADLHISRELVPAPKSAFTHANIIQQENQSQEELQATLSWLQYIQYAADLLPLTTHPNSSQCFFCASLSRPLLTAVPINFSFYDLHGPLPVRKTQDIPLFNLTPPLCLVGPSSKPHLSCAHDITITKSICVSPPALLWCKDTTGACINPHFQGSCAPVIVVPQVYLYEPEELALQMGGSRKKREIFIPLLIGLGLAVSLGATGTAGAALVQTQHLAGDFQDKLDQAMASTTDSLESLQRQITSLAGVTLQNRRALDLLTAEHGGTCVLLGEECCFYVNESGLVEQDVQTLKELRGNLRARYTPNTPTPWYSNPLMAWILPLLGPILAIGALLLLAPCLIQFLKQQISSLAKVTTNQVSVQYQTVPNIGDTYSDDTSPL